MSISEFPKQLFIEMRKMGLFYPGWLMPFAKSNTPSAIHTPLCTCLLLSFTFLSCSDSEGQPPAPTLPAGWAQGSARWAAAPGDPAVSSSFPGRKIRQSSPGLLCRFSRSYWKINDLWVIYRFGQVGKLKPEKLPGVFCWKPSSARSEGAGCISEARATHQRLGFASAQ